MGLTTLISCERDGFSIVKTGETQFNGTVAVKGWLKQDDRSVEHEEDDKPDHHQGSDDLFSLDTF